VSYGTRILEGLPNIISFFQFFTIYAEWTEDQKPLLSGITKNMRFLDTSIYDTRIRDNLLYLDPDIANDVSLFDQLIRLINDYVESNLRIINSSQATMLSEWLRENNRRFALAQEFLKMLTDTTTQFRTALLKRRKKTGIDWTPLLVKSQEMTTIMGIPKSMIN